MGGSGFSAIHPEQTWGEFGRDVLHDLQTVCPSREWMDSLAGFQSNDFEFTHLPQWIRSNNVVRYSRLLLPLFNNAVNCALIIPSRVLRHYR